MTRDMDKQRGSIVADNLSIWNKVSRPPREALKTITGGRLSGMTDVNPQWRMKVMTETFGPCGVGWHYEITKLWTEPGPEGVVMAFAMVNLWAGKDSMPIPGIGGSAMVAQEKSGLRGNDEAYKMAVTDALSVAMKALGVAADIYAGLWDGTKYTTVTTVPNTPTQLTKDAFELLSKEQKNMILDTATQVVDALNEDRDFDAFSLCETLTDSEEKMALWSRLDSKQRRRIKEQAAKT